MILIESILVDERMPKTKFSCDVSRCKGACCTLSGGGGAPVALGEIDEIQAALDSAIEYISDISRNHIEKHGAIVQTEKEFETSCIDSKDCVFVFYENDIAKCSLEKAYFDGKTTFRKPLSCHLFPLRIRQFGGDFLSFEPFQACKPGTENGIDANIDLIDYLQEPIIRAYGAEWYNRLKDYCRKQETEKAEL